MGWWFAIPRFRRALALVLRGPLFLDESLASRHLSKLTDSTSTKKLFICFVRRMEAGATSDADDAVSYGPGLRWGVMGPTLQWHLGGGANGIQHFLDHLMDPLAGLMKALGTPDVTPELKKTIAEGVAQMTGDHSVRQLAQEENRLLVDLIKLRAQQAKALAAEAHA
jgi:hypothetical protein